MLVYAVCACCFCPSLWRHILYMRTITVENCVGNSIGNSVKSWGYTSISIMRYWPRIVPIVRHPRNYSTVSKWWPNMAMNKIEYKNEYDTWIDHKICSLNIITFVLKLRCYPLILKKKIVILMSECETKSQSHSLIWRDNFFNSIWLTIVIFDEKILIRRRICCYTN